MARFVVVLLLVAAGALVVALFFDQRGRRDVRLERLRQAFLHGQPLPGYAHPTSLAEVVHPKGVTFRAPRAWTIDRRDGEKRPVEVPGGSRCVELEVFHLDGPRGASLTEVMTGLPTEGDHTIETLQSGHVLMKTVEPARGSDGLLASYTWRLGRATADGLRLAVFRLRLPVESAAELIAQVDLATLEREVREAKFSDGPGGRSDG